MKIWNKFSSWTAAILFVAGCILLSKCTSVTIFNTKVTVLDSATPFFARPGRRNTAYGPAYGPEAPAERALRSGVFNGTTLSKISIHTSHGDVEVPAGSVIGIKQALYGAAGYITFEKKAGFNNSLEVSNTMFGRNISYVRLTPSGGLVRFKLKKAVPITLDNINLDILSMGKGALERQRGMKYISLSCGNFLPIVLKENEKIYLNDAIKPFVYEGEDMDDEFGQYQYNLRMEMTNAEFKGFDIQITQNDYGFYRYRFSYDLGTRFVIEHPSLSGKLEVCEVEFDVSFNEIISYRVNHKEEEVVLASNKKSREELYGAMERSAIFRNRYDKALEFSGD
jgi:hypothetical protein